MRIRISKLSVEDIDEPLIEQNKKAKAKLDCLSQRKQSKKQTDSKLKSKSLHIDDKKNKP